MSSTAAPSETQLTAMYCPTRSRMRRQPVLYRRSRNRPYPSETDRYIAAPISLLQGTSAPATAGTSAAGSGGSQRRQPDGAGAAGRCAAARSSASEPSTASGSAAERIMRALLPLSAA